MVLIDTTVWIDFFGGRDTKKVDKASTLIQKNKVCVCPTIVQEILQGTKSEKDFNLLKTDLLAFNVLLFDPIEAAVGAANIYRAGRKIGLTIRKSNDCLIAWHALKAGIPLLTDDSDFHHIASFTDLQLEI